MTATVRLQREPFDAAVEAAKLTRGRTDIGAVVTFTGICRGHEAGAPLVAMTLEHYPGMAEAEIARHAEAAEQRWPLLGVTVVHRYGRLAPGEDIVLVVTAAAHRQEAFAAAEFLMDFLKTRAPFWKAGRICRREGLGRCQAIRRRIGGSLDGYRAPRGGGMIRPLEPIHRPALALLGTGQGRGTIGSLVGGADLIDRRARETETKR